MPRPVTPPVAVDVIIELADRPGRPVVLIKRRNPPHGYALPGGFVDLGERVEDAARREALEETGLEIELRSLLGVYSDPGRDPRGHTVSIVYVAEARGRPQAGDDASRVFEAQPGSPPPLVFDHDRVLRDYLERFRQG